MAKKKSSVKRKSKARALPENALPQNILPMGERVEEDKNIYISQKVYKEIHKFTRNKTTDESGGMLIGSVIEEFGKTNILVSGFVEARYCEATPTTLKFTHETWEYVHKEVEKKHPGKKILGWIHTHPDFGIFLSEYDKFIHENFFSEQNQIAYVIDPIQGIEGFYFWINGKLEKCKGFYIYERNGAKIDIDRDAEAVPAGASGGLFTFRNVLLAALSAAVILLAFSNYSMNKKVEQLQAQQQALVTSANQSLAYLQQQIQLIAQDLGTLQKALAGESTDPSIPSISDKGSNATDPTQNTDPTENPETTDGAE